MNNYNAHPSHYLVSSLICFFGEIALHNAWIVFGWAMYALGALSALVISYAFVMEIRYINRVGDESESEIDEQESAQNEAAQTNISITEGNTIRLYQLPATPRQLEMLASGLIIANDPFSERRWAGAGKPFSVARFKELRDEMIRRGLACHINDKDHRQGYCLTLAGKAALKKYLPHSPTVPDLAAFMVDA